VDVLVYLPSLAIGGAQRTTLNLVNHLGAHGIRPLLALGATSGPMAHEINGSVQTADLRARRARHAVVPLARLIRERRPAVLFAPMPEASVTAAVAWRMSGGRCALVVRESNYRGDPEAAGPAPSRWLLPWAYRQADRVVALSHGVRNDIVDRYTLDPRRVSTIHNPVDLARIEALGERPCEVAQRASPHLLAVGRLIRQKGFDVLLQALAALKSPDAQLTILGDGPERSALTALARTLGISSRVHLPGYVANPYACMKQADLFVLSSRWEGFGHVIVEAMTCDLPVVATRCPFGPEEIITHERDGLLCVSESAADLAVQIDRLIESPELRGRLAAEARHTVQRFSAASVAAQYASVLHEAGEARLEASRCSRV
jgi:glycosyltransferase involved in cell wall biosynthesis